MCKLVVGIKTSNKADKEFANLIASQAERLKGEKDGIGALAIKDDNSHKVLRDLKDYDGVINTILTNVRDKKIISLHTRTGTSGNTDLSNVHFFQSDRYMLAHNGFVSKYSRGIGFRYGGNYGYNSLANDEAISKINKSLGDKSVNSISSDIPDFDDLVQDNPKLDCQDCARHDNELQFCSKHKAYGKKLKKLRKKVMREREDRYESSDSRCDSKQFLDNLPKKVTRDTLEKYIDETDFTGIAVLVDKELHKLWLLGTRDFEVHTDYKNYIILYSYEPESSLPTYTKLLGLPVVNTEDTMDFDTHKVPAGVYDVGYSKLQGEITKVVR